LLWGLTASQLLEPDYPDLIKIFRSMIEPDPSCRPTAAEALKSVHEYHDGFTRAQLKGSVPKPNLSPMSFSQMVKRTHEANARQAVREKKRLEAELAKASVASS
jgi:serine/threonine protein kinase